jgi:nitrite reductase/ring-hydroxylating ferredoxin subunit
MSLERWLPLCAGEALRDGGDGLRFEVRVGAEAATGFAVRHGGEVRAYLNRCAHVAMELDWQPGRFFDDEQRWLLCATHGALYEPASGYCAGGPCAGRGGLRPIRVRERDGVVYWQPDDEVRAPPAA